MKTTSQINSRFEHSNLTHQAELITKDLRELFSSHGNVCYLLLDPFLRSFNDDDLINERIKNNQIIMIKIPHPSVDSQKTPFMLKLDLNDPDDSDLLYHSVYESLYEIDAKQIDMGNGRRFCGWLSANQATKPEDLAQYIGRVAIQRLSEDRTILLRLYDPAVMLQLWFLLTEVQKRILFGLATGWSVITNEAEFYTFQVSKEKLFGAYTLGISDEQYGNIRLIGPINRALCTYGQTDSIERPWISEFQAPSLLLPTFERTRKYTFNSYSELNDLASKALEIHPFFDQHPLIVSRAGSLSAPINYSDIVHGISGHEWAIIRNDCVAKHGSLSDLIDQYK